MRSIIRRFFGASPETEQARIAKDLHRQTVQETARSLFRVSETTFLDGNRKEAIEYYTHALLLQESIQQGHPGDIQNISLPIKRQCAAEAIRMIEDEWPSRMTLAKGVTHH